MTLSSPRFPANPSELCPMGPALCSCSQRSIDSILELQVRIIPQKHRAESRLTMISWAEFKMLLLFEQVG